MAKSLSGACGRVDRLVQHLRGSAGEDFDKRLNSMHDDELEWHIVNAIEKVTGPIEAFGSVVALTEKFTSSGWDAAKWPSLLDCAGKHIERRRWFQAHAPHGKPELVQIDAVWPRHRPFGRGLVVACPCSRSDPGNHGRGRLGTYVDLVPTSFRQILGIS
jgi:hypothetical protein